MKTTRIAAMVWALSTGLAGVAAAAGGAGTTVDVKGHYYETCGCNVTCPCATMKYLPSEGHCDAVMMFNFDKASVGKTKLDGLKLAIVIKSPKNQKVFEAFSKGDMDHFAVYIDDKMTEDQRKVIPQLIEGLFGKMEIKNAKAPAFVPITLTVDGDKANIDIGAGKLTAEIENIVIGETKVGNKTVPKYLKLEGEAPFPWLKMETQGRSASFHYADGPVKWDYKDRNAFFGEFTHKTTLPAAAAAPAAK
jgi:hypothetical protein